MVFQKGHKINTGRKQSKEHIKNRSEARKGTKAPWTTKRNLENNPMKNPITRQKISETHKKLFREGKMKLQGVAQKGNLNYTKIHGNPFQGKHHTEESKKKLSEAHKRENLSEATLRKMSEAKKGKPNPKCSETKKRLFMEGKLKTVFQKGNTAWNNPNAIGTRFKDGHSFPNEIKLKMLKNQRKALNLRPNKPEKIVINLIQQNNLNFIYVGDGKKWLHENKNFFNPDFIHKEKKLIIEVFGDYWHNRKEIRERDGRRLLCYSNGGYKTLVIWENELQNPSQVLNTIKQFVQKK